MSNQLRKLRLKVSHDPLDISSVRCHGMSTSQLLALPNYCGENGLFLHNHTVQCKGVHNPIQSAQSVRSI